MTYDLVGENDNYKFVKNIGKGANGRVDKMVGQNSRKEFAVKIYSGENQVNDEKEAAYLIKKVGKCNPNLLCIYDHGRKVDEYFLVFELADGDISTFTFTFESLFWFFEDALRGVEQMHQLGIAHNDLKPQNILYTFEERRPGGQKEIVFKIGDFGSACFLNRECILVGNLAYVSPDLIRSVDSKISTEQGMMGDMWSLGFIFHKMFQRTALGFTKDQGNLRLELPYNSEGFKKMEKTLTGIEDWGRMMIPYIETITQDEIKVRPKGRVGTDNYELFESIKTLMVNLLMVDPKRRWNSREALDYFIIQIKPLIYSH